MSKLFSRLTLVVSITALAGCSNQVPASYSGSGGVSTTETAAGGTSATVTSGGIVSGTGAATTSGSSAASSPTRDPDSRSAPSAPNPRRRSHNAVTRAALSVSSASTSGKPRSPSTWQGRGGLHLRVGIHFSATTPMGLRRSTCLWFRQSHSGCCMDC